MQLNTYTICEIGLFTEDVEQNYWSFDNFTYVIVAVYFTAFESVIVSRNTRRPCYASKRAYIYTVEPLNKGHFGSRDFVLFSEVVLWWEVQSIRSFIDLIYLDNMF